MMFNLPVNISCIPTWAIYIYDEKVLLLNSNVLYFILYLVLKLEVFDANNSTHTFRIDEITFNLKKMLDNKQRYQFKNMNNTRLRLVG